MVGFEFWKDAAGSVWAVRVVDGDVTGACGPLRGAEVDSRWLPTYAYDAQAGARIQERRGEFALLSEDELLMLSAATD